MKKEKKLQNNNNKEKKIKVQLRDVVIINIFFHFAVLRVLFLLFLPQFQKENVVRLWSHKFWLYKSLAWVWWWWWADRLTDNVGLFFIWSRSSFQMGNKDNFKNMKKIKTKNWKINLWSRSAFIIIFLYSFKKKHKIVNPLQNCVTGSSKGVEWNVLLLFLVITQLSFVLSRWVFRRIPFHMRYLVLFGFSRVGGSSILYWSPFSGQPYQLPVQWLSSCSRLPSEKWGAIFDSRRLKWEIWNISRGFAAA